MQLSTITFWYYYKKFNKYLKRKLKMLCWILKIHLSFWNMRPQENKNLSFPCFVPARYQGLKLQTSQACQLKKWKRNKHIKRLAKKIKRQKRHCLKKVNQQSNIVIKENETRWYQLTYWPNEENCLCKQNVLNTRSMTYWCMKVQGENSPVLEGYIWCTSSLVINSLHGLQYKQSSSKNPATMFNLFRQH